LDKYLKNGKECILCTSRKKLIQITPEEIVRQEFVSKLINEYEVPESLIAIEVPLSYYQKGRKGRADIIVSGYNKEYNETIPLIVIECKAPHIHLTDKVFQQIMKYDEFLLPEIMIMTNGVETISYSWDKENKDYREIKSIPKYSELIKGKGIEFAENIVDNWTRPNHLDSIETNYDFLLADYHIGEDTEKSLVPFITNLVGLIYDDTEKTEHLNLIKKSFISDGGLRFTTFGNAAGGSFPGIYRYFMVQNENLETEIVSISIMGKISAKNHPKWGNSKGLTLFNVAIDDFENSHMSLEYSIDRFVKIENNLHSFWHDGTLTIGKKGRVKNADVINFMHEHSPHLIKENKIFLGSVDNSKPFKWEDESISKLIANFIEYGFVRDKFRKAHN